MAQSILVVTGDHGLVSALRIALNRAGMVDLVLDRAPSAALALRILETQGKQIDAVVLDLTDRRSAIEALQELRDFAGEPRVLGAALSPEADDGAAAARFLGGCRVFRRAEDLPGLLAVKSAGARRQAPARLILFAPAQDGAGASTTALHAASVLVKSYRLRTLFAELDYHSDSVACRLRIANAKSLVDLQPGEDWRAALASWDGMHVLTAPSSTRILRRRGLPDLASVLADTGGDYDIVVGDLPCNTAVATPQVLGAANRIYVVSTAEVVSLHLAGRRILELCKVGANKDAIRLIINRDRPGAVDADLARQVTGLAPVCRLPNDYGAASEAETEGRTVSPSSALGAAYARLAEDILGRPAPAKVPLAKSWSKLFGWR